MIYEDRVYGRVNLHPMLAELMETKPMQRLKKISQHGPTQFTASVLDITRFEHSAGVAIIIQKLGGSLEEQVAGLLHDISHTAFSHVVDFLFKNREHTYHEKFHREFIMNSKIPGILERAGMDVKHALDVHSHPLLEKPIPDVCADRTDYFYRDMFVYGALTREQVMRSLASLMNHDNEIVLKDRPSARFYADMYIKGNELMWANPLLIFWFQILADALGLGMKHGVITKQDLFLTDTEVYDRLRKSGNPEILEKLELLSKNIKLVEDSENYEIHLIPKVRWVDPKFLQNGKLVRLSSADEEYVRKLKEFKQKIDNGYFVRAEHL